MTTPNEELTQTIQRLEALRAEESEPAVAQHLDRALDILREHAETRAA